MLYKLKETLLFCLRMSKVLTGLISIGPYVNNAVE